MSILRTPDDPLLIAEYRRFNLTWSDVGRFLRVYWLSILLVFLATVGATYLVLSMTSDKYESSAKLLVKVGRETLDTPPTTSSHGGTFVSAGLRKEDVTSEVQILTSQNVMTEVVDHIGTDRFKPSAVTPQGFFPRIKFEVKKFARAVKDRYEEFLITMGLQKRLNDREKVIVGLMNDITVTPEKETDVITVALRASDPELGNAVLAQLISIYLTRRVQVRQSTGVREFLAGESQRAQGQLLAAESARNQWKQVNQLSQTAAQKETLIHQIRELSALHGQTLSEIQAATGQITEGRKLLADTPKTLTTSEIETANPPAQIYRNELAGLELQRSKLLAKYDEGSDRVRLLDEEIGRLKTLIKDEQAKQVSSSTREMNPLVKSLEQRLQEDDVRLEGLKQRERTQTAEMGNLDASLRHLETADAQLTDLERDRQVSEENYLSMVKRKNDADVTIELDRSRLSNVSVLAEPASSIEPVYPRRKLIMGISLAIGLALGIGFCLLFEWMSGLIRSPEEMLQVSRLPYLGTVHLPTGAEL